MSTRAFLPGVILAWSGDIDWGTYRLVLTESFHLGALAILAGLVAISIPPVFGPIT